MVGLETTLETFLTHVQTVLQSIGFGICIIGIIVGGLMRATAFGNERKIAASNVALSCAVVGFAIVLLSTILAGAVSSIVSG